MMTIVIPDFWLGVIVGAGICFGLLMVFALAWAAKDGGNV